eukprot:CAMPEP_0203944552 /NCGR_PEP_ID=MMETSP0359-20131031/80288_1 /ASSEMBLY_ACC=CAM_ASM_000338 /TAXON_ID=268821 /ORGANISM="Scrippsiella Hangoei, Strain SHTV-5" /LENGTH=80 /DNA_ID=CAMNT_0050875593 /DNA_START=270 /DNA_END=508 /DNA_ORIENTATION=-
MLLQESSDAPHIGGHEQAANATIHDDHAARAVRPSLLILRDALHPHAAVSTRTSNAHCDGVVSGLGAADGLAAALALRAA